MLILRLENAFAYALLRDLVEHVHVLVIEAEADRATRAAVEEGLHRGQEALAAHFEVKVLAVPQQLAHFQHPVYLAGAFLAAGALHQHVVGPYAEDHLATGDRFFLRQFAVQKQKLNLVFLEN